MTKISVVTKKAYKTEVLVNNEFAYESFLHRKVEVDNLKKLFYLMRIYDVEVTDGDNGK